MSLFTVSTLAIGWEKLILTLGHIKNYKISGYAKKVALQAQYWCIVYMVVKRNE